MATEGDSRTQAVNLLVQLLARVTSSQRTVPARALAAHVTRLPDLHGVASAATVRLKEDGLRQHPFYGRPVRYDHAREVFVAPTDFPMPESVPRFGGAP